MIDQTPSGKFIIVGEPKVHKSLASLVKYYQQNPINEDGDLLSVPCGQVSWSVAVWQTWVTVANAWIVAL